MMQHFIQCSHMMPHSAPFSFITIYKVQRSVFWIIHGALRRGMFCWIFYFRYFYVCVWTYVVFFSSFRLRIRKVNVILVGCRICSRPDGFAFEHSMKMRWKIDLGRVLFFRRFFSILCFENVTCSEPGLFCIYRIVCFNIWVQQC